MGAPATVEGESNTDGVGVPPPLVGGGGTGGGGGGSCGYGDGLPTLDGAFDFFNDRGGEAGEVAWLGGVFPA